MKLRLLIVSLMVALLSVLANSTVAFAWDEDVGLSNEWSEDWWADAQGFATTIDAYTGWNEYFISNDPLPTWWQEESSGGMDNWKADFTELSVMEGHSVDLDSGLIGVGFGTEGSTGPSSVRLGYSSPDSYGYNIWWFIIECEVFKDTSYPSWMSSLTGTHMLLGFENSPTITSTDLREMANRLTGSGGYSTE